MNETNMKEQEQGSQRETEGDAFSHILAHGSYNGERDKPSRFT
jgi:hypothetical protein